MSDHPAENCVDSDCADVTPNADSGGRYRTFEQAVLALAALMCPQEVHCDRCRNQAATTLHDLAPQPVEIVRAHSARPGPITP
jgi:hypothetical protein